MAKTVDWEGVFPAVTTQIRRDFSIVYDATARVIDALIRDVVSGLILCGTVGENNSQSRDEKIKMMEMAKTAAKGRVPVVVGVAEYTSELAAGIAREVKRT